MDAGRLMIDVTAIDEASRLHTVRLHSTLWETSREGMALTLCFASH